MTWRAEEGWPAWEGPAAPDAPGVAVDADDYVFVFAREDPSEVVVLAPDGSEVRRFGAGVFGRAHGVHVDHDGFVWCADDADHTVRKFTRTGELLLTLGTPGEPSDNGTAKLGGKYGGFDPRDVARGGPPFHAPTDVHVLRDGTVYVTDGYGNARVHRFGAGGELQDSFGGPGDGPGEFVIPHGIVASPDEDRLFVCDRENSRVQVFEPDGTFVTEWTHLCRPDGIALSPDGLLCVTELGRLSGRWDHFEPITPDTPHGTVAVLDLGGDVLARWGTADPARVGSFVAPHGVAVDSTGAIYIGEVAHAGGKSNPNRPDAGWHTLQKFTRSG